MGISDNRIFGAFDKRRARMFRLADHYPTNATFVFRLMERSSADMI